MVRSITVASGKGGVGKSCVSINLALTYAASGLRVTLVDADFGLANTHVLMGHNLRHSLRDVISGTHNVEDVVATLEGGVRLLSGGTGHADMINLNTVERQQAIRMIQSVAKTSDLVVVDAPGGVSDATMAFAAASERVLLVMVGEPTSIMDCYTLAKVAALDYGVRRFSCFVNMANSRREALEHYHKFCSAAKKFIDVEFSFAGHLPYSQKMRQSVLDRRPLVRAHPGSLEATAFEDLANNVFRGPVNSQSGLSLRPNEPIAERV